MGNTKGHKELKDMKYSETDQFTPEMKHKAKLIAKHPKELRNMGCALVACQTELYTFTSEDYIHSNCDLFLNNGKH